jgi:hypothetical protein
MHLLIILILRIITSILLLSRLCFLSPNATRTSTTEGRAEREVDVLLGIETDNEGRNVDDLLANTDVSLTDENTSVVDGLSETEFVDTGLQTTLQEILNLQCQNVIELHAGFVKNTNTDETANEGVSFEESLGVLLVEGEQLTAEASVDMFSNSQCRCIPGSTTDLGKGELDTPDLTLVAESILANELQLRVPRTLLMTCKEQALLQWPTYKRADSKATESQQRPYFNVKFKAREEYLHNLRRSREAEKSTGSAGFKLTPPWDFRSFRIGAWRHGCDSWLSTSSLEIDTERLEIFASCISPVR